MYYPDEVIESVRQGSDIVDVVSQYVKLQRRGANYFGLCPFHNEKSPSFSVTPSKQMYYCFGCGAGGNAITFLMEYENYSFQEAVQTLAERAGIPLPQVEQTEEERRKSNRKQILLEIQKEAARYFYFQLRSEQGKIGYDYLKGRGLQEETIRSFGLGYSLAYSNDLYQYLKKKGYTDDILRDSGLITYEERGIHDKFWNRVMFPIMDINSKVIGFGGRVMGDGKPKYLNSPETMIFDKSRNLYGMHVARRTKKPYFLICEGYMDVISLHQAGFTNAVAALGTAFTIQHGILMKRYTKEVILTFDSDEAGQKAALRALPILKSAGLAVKVLDMKPYKDPDEFLGHLGAEAYQERIDHAMNGFLFEISVLRNEYDFSDPQQKTDFVNACARKLTGFTDEVERTNYIEAVARTYLLDFESLRRKVNAYGAAGYGEQEEREHRYDMAVSVQEEEEKRNKRQQVRQKEKDDANGQAQRLMLTWLSEEPELFTKIKEFLTPDDFTEPLYHQIAVLLYGQLEAGNLQPGEILNHFINDENEYREAARVFHTKLAETMTEEERTRAFQETIRRMKKNSLDVASRNAQSVEELQKIMQAQSSLKNLHISLN